MTTRTCLLRCASIAAVGLAVAAVLPAGAALAAGSRVSVVPTAALARTASFTAVSFAAADDGWAVGSVGEPLGDSGIDTLIEHWNGASWSLYPTPAVPFSDETLTGVALTGTADGWAVGRQDRYGYRDDVPVLLHWDGTAWALSRAPSPAVPVAIAAAGPADVWAVGGASMQHYDGARWQPSSAPNSTVNLTGVTVVSATDAWAVGSVPDTRSGYNHTAHPYVVHWNGVAWSEVAVPAPSSDARLAAVSAGSAGDVWAVGSSAASSEDAGGAFILHLTGAGWLRVPSGSQGNQDGLSGVSATPTGQAWAVGHRDGYTRTGSAVWRTLIQRWDGQAWRIVASPNDSDSDNYLTSVTVPAARTVWALGADGQPLAERISG